VHPEAFRLGSLTVHWYGILLVAGFLAAIWTANRRGQRAGLSPSSLSDLAIWLLVGGIVGARLLHVVSYWERDFAGRPWWEAFAVWRGGLVFYGGLIGATVAGAVFARSKRLPFFRTADVLAPSIALGSVFGRLGCLLTGCCFGQPCGLPWAIQFPIHSLPWEEQARRGLIGTDEPALPVHPTQLYDSLANLLLYLGLAWLFRRRRFDGQVFGAFLIGYAVLRSLVELARGDYGAADRWGPLTPAQAVSGLILLAGVAVLLRPRPGPSAAK